MLKRFLWAASVATLCLVRPAGGDSTPDMLERALRAVVTVAEYKVLTVPLRDERGQLKRLPVRKARSPSLYGRILDLSGAFAHGSGFLIEHKGNKYVVTNAHVVAWATEDPEAIAIFTPDQKRYPVKVLAADTFFDIAVLAFADKQPGNDVSTLALRDGHVRVGETVYALGNPLGRYPYSVSDGIIGGKERSGLLMSPGYLQTTATVIWGNSGGPLVDQKGQVVGVNTFISLEKRGGHVFIQPQLNFALGAATARRVIGDLLTHRRVRRAYLGLQIVRDFQIKRTAKGMMVDPASGGAPTVISVVPGSPAAKAFADKLGARIVRINGASVRDLPEVFGALEQARPRDKVVFELQGPKGSQTVSVVAGEMDAPALGELGKHIFRAVGYEVAEGARGLVLKRPAGARETREPDMPWKDLPKFPVDPKRYGPFYKNPEELYRFRGMDYKDTKRGFKRIDRQPDNLLIIAVGAVDEDGDGQLWRAKELAELGIACRLTARTGRLDVAYLSADGKSCRILKCRLSRSGGVETKALLY